MTGYTSNYSFPYPEGDDAVAVHTDIRRLARAVDTEVHSVDTKHGDVTDTVQEHSSALAEHERKLNQVDPGEDTDFRIMDLSGRVAFEITERGSARFGGAEHQDSSGGYRILDQAGRIALEVDRDGRTHIHDPAFQTDSGPVRTNFDAKFESSEPEPAEYFPVYMDRNDRTTMINHMSNQLRYSRDEGRTWHISHTFDETVRTGLILDNGEVIVYTADGDNERIASIWLSDGWQEDPENAQWTLVLTFETPGAYPSAAFSWSHHQNVVTAGEYGPKKNVSGREHNAKYMYLSMDYGKTWRTVLNLETDAPNFDPDAEYGNHIHGTLFDPYWDRLWVTYGDSVHGGTDIIFSDDMGDTWHSVGPFPDPSMSYQSVGMYALPNCVLFATDGAPNGVLRIDRRQGKHAGPYHIESAYRHDDSTSLTILCQSIWRANRPGDDAPVVFEFVSAPGEGRRFILTTVDGYTFNKVWEDPEITRGNSSGRAFGPTASGRLLHYAVDERFESSSRTLRYGPMPNAY